MRRIAVFAVAAVVAVLAAVPPAHAETTGSIEGTITDGSGAPLPGATVMLEGTVLGALAAKDGRYRIEGIVPGTYAVLIRHIGHEPLRRAEVRVEAGRATRLDAAVREQAIQVGGVTVTTGREILKPEDSGTEHEMRHDEVRARAVHTVDEALTKQAGVIERGGELYVRGARSDEVVFEVNGVPVTDPLGGHAHMEVSLSSLDAVSLISGGFDAERGNAQAGIVDLTTKEGGPKPSGQVRFMTDDFGAPDKSYFNTDNLTAGLGGPMPVKGLSYYVSGEALATDTYLRTREVRPRWRFLGMPFRERQRNLMSGQGKLSWQLGSAKFTAETLFSEEAFDRYAHEYSRAGFWSPTSGPAGTGLWWFEPLDSTFTYYNGPDHTPNYLNRHRESQLRFSRSYGPHTLVNAVFAWHDFYSEAVVKGKDPAAYDYTTTSQNDRDPLNLFYVIRGDAGNWHKQWSRTFTWKADLSRETPGDENHGHLMKSGILLERYDLRYDLRDFPSPANPLGLFPDQYHVRPWGASAYIQDRYRYEGMVVNAGLRFDAFDPSKDSFERANGRRALLGLPPAGTSLRDRLIWQVSPRLGMSYPITDRDKLHFHYGRFQEIPRLENLYRYTGGNATINPTTIIGNPFLQAKTTISYEVGVEHEFWGESSIEVAFFYRDEFGLIGTRQEEAAIYDPRNPPGISYANMDYGTSQGVEFTLRKYVKPTGHWSGGLTYTWSRTTGSSESETQGFNVLTGGQDRAPIREVTLPWDQPHVLTANLYLQEPGVWGVDLEAAYQSGWPFTPIGLYDKATPSAKLYSARLPASYQVSCKVDKRYRFYGREYSLFLQGTNLTDRKNVYQLDPGNGSRYYTIYYTEQGKFGGAYNLRDVRKDLATDVLVPLHDPSVFEEPRNFKAGIEFDW